MAALGLLGVLQSSVVMQLSEDVKYAWQRSSLHLLAFLKINLSLPLVDEQQLLFCFLNYSCHSMISHSNNSPGFCHSFNSRNSKCSCTYPCGAASFA